MKVMSRRSGMPLSLMKRIKDPTEDKFNLLQINWKCNGK